MVVEAAGWLVWGEVTLGSVLRVHVMCIIVRTKTIKALPYVK